MILGVDVSAYQATARMRDIAAAGATFVIVKVTEGNGYANPHARAQVEAALDAGLFVMLYHFAHPCGPDWIGDARAEAQRFCDITDSFDAHLQRRLQLGDPRRNAGRDGDGRPAAGNWPPECPSATASPMTVVSSRRRTCACVR